MKDYNFVIWGAKQNFPHKEGGWSKRGGGLQRFCSLRGGVGQKERGDFFEGGGSYSGVHYAKDIARGE